VQLAAGIREHRQAIEFLFAIVFGSFERLLVFPLLLRGLFEGGWVVLLFHVHTKIGGLK
jgi:hypothetical protein